MWTRKKIELDTGHSKSPITVTTKSEGRKHYFIFITMAERIYFYKLSKALWAKKKVEFFCCIG